MPPDRPFSEVPCSSSRAPDRARHVLFAGALALLVLLAAAPAALAWHGNLEIRKVNVGGPATDSFSFKVEAGAYGQPNFALVPASDYTGASWNAKSKPDNPFALVGAPSAAGPFTTAGPSPTAARFTELDSGGQSPAAAPAVRDWRRFRITETAKPANYTTSVACTIRNDASSAGWDSGLDPAWGTWSAVTTTDGAETTLRFLPDTVALAHRGPWTTTCTFTNTYVAPPVTPTPTPTTPPASGTETAGPTSGVTGPPGASNTPGGPVTPSATPRAGTARVQGRTGCIRGAFAIADVRGRGIVKVIFKVNGRTVRTLTNANVAGMYRLKVPTASLPRGASRATADVRFRAASRVAPRRLSFALVRCPSRTSRPPLFTG